MHLLPDFIIIKKLKEGREGGRSPQKPEKKWQLQFFHKRGACEKGVYRFNEALDLNWSMGFFYSVPNPIKYQNKIKRRVLGPFNPGGFLPDSGFRIVN